MNTDDENRGRTQPATPPQGQPPKQADPGGIRAGNEEHTPQPRRISQEEMQKIMPPSPDPDDPQSP